MLTPQLRAAKVRRLRIPQRRQGGKTMRTAFSVIACAAAFAVTSLADAEAGAPGQIEHAAVNTHRSQGEIKRIDGATARLLRTAEGIFVNLETLGLTPGHAYTLLLATINSPGGCAASPCEPADVLGRTAAIGADIVGVADGTIAGADGTARFASFLPAGELPGAWFGNGLQDPAGAEIHLVVNDHGPFLPELGAAMVTTYRGGCADDSVPAPFPDVAKADGAPGPNTCRLLQAAIFAAAGM
jgi:hypothetical protein